MINYKNATYFIRDILRNEMMYSDPQRKKQLSQAMEVLEEMLLKTLKNS